jgi:hypothetical protein
MPATFTLVKSTPYSVVYRVDGGADGTEGTLDYTSAPKLTELVAGPYRYYIVRGLSGFGFGGSVNQLAKLNLDGALVGPARVRIHLITGMNLSNDLPETLTLKWTATGLSATFPGSTGETPQSLLIEIRFRHSSLR